MWLYRVKRVHGEKVQISWKNFCLEQANSKEGPEWRAWEQPDEHERRSLAAAAAAEAARRQGGDAFDRYHLALLIARHGGERRIPLNEERPLPELAEQVGLDIERFRADLRDRELRRIVGRDHAEAVEKHGVFGTPTFVFENGNSVYVKTFVPPEEESASFFEHFIDLMAHRSYIGELKRPQPPWPKGAVG